MKKLCLVFFSVFALMLLNSLSVQAEDKNKKLIGEWIYQVTEAPYGYEKGSLIFSKKDGKTTGLVKLETGELPLSELKIENDSIRFVAYIDGSPINVKLKLTENKLIGTVDSPEGPKVIVAEKKKE